MFEKKICLYFGVFGVNKMIIYVNDCKRGYEVKTSSGKMGR